MELKDLGVSPQPRKFFDKSFTRFFSKNRRVVGQSPTVLISPINLCLNQKNSMTVFVIEFFIESFCPIFREPQR